MRHAGRRYLVQSTLAETKAAILSNWGKPTIWHGLKCRCNRKGLASPFAGAIICAAVVRLGSHLITFDVPREEDGGASLSAVVGDFALHVLGKPVRAL